MLRVKNVKMPISSFKTYLIKIWSHLTDSSNEESGRSPLLLISLLFAVHIIIITYFVDIPNVVKNEHI